jgi:hypothetical protein
MLADLLQRPINLIKDVLSHLVRVSRLIALVDKLMRGLDNEVLLLRLAGILLKVLVDILNV